MFDWRGSVSQENWYRTAHCRLTYLVRRVYSAKVPPSPSSSARRTMTIYLTDTIRVIVQTIRDTAPKRSSWDGVDRNVEE